MDKTICVISNTARSIYNFRLNLMRKLKNQNYEIIALAPYDRYAEKVRTEFQFINIRYLNRSGMNPFVDLILFFQFFKYLRKIKPAIVLNFTIKPNIYSSFACMILKIKYICSVTGLGYIFHKRSFISFLVKQMFKTVFKYSKKVICQNNDDRKQLIDENIVDKNNIIITPGSGVDLNKFYNENICKSDNGYDIKFIMVCRLIREKGILEYVEASKIIQKESEGVKFFLMGPFDPDNPSFISESEIKLWHDKGYIEYLGETDDIKEYLNKADVVVLPSYYREGIPRILLEALSMGKPIITSDSIGCRETVDDKKNGYLIPIKNIQALVDAFRKMINLSQEEYKEMGIYSREKACKEFDENIVIEKYLQEVKKVC